MHGKKIGIRWTIGDVSEEGFEALRLSVWGAYRAFGEEAAYAICLNTVPVAIASLRTGALPHACTWHETTQAIPRSLAPYLDRGMAQGAAWKLAPLRFFTDCYELSLDNDCILWGVPEAVQRWLSSSDGRCLLAEDVRAYFGQFTDACGHAPRNAGIRGLPPDFDLERAMLDVLQAYEVKLSSEVDEQGLQVAAVSRARPPEVVPLTDVTICSPFPPHLRDLGRCGAHFCGLNARDLGWRLDGRPASSYVRHHWRGHRSELYARVGLGSPQEEMLMRARRAARTS